MFGRVFLIIVMRVNIVMCQVNITMREVNTYEMARQSRAAETKDSENE